MQLWEYIHMFWQLRCFFMKFLSFIWNNSTSILLVRLNIRAKIVWLWEVFCQKIYVFWHSDSLQKLRIFILYLFILLVYSFYNHLHSKNFFYIILYIPHEGLLYGSVCNKILKRSLKSEEYFDGNLGYYPFKTFLYRPYISYAWNGGLSAII